MRIGRLNRSTLETNVTVVFNLDGSGQTTLNTGVPFLDHMLDQIARHGLMDITVEARGDLHIDAHHTVEDVGITLGQAFIAAIGDKKGVRRMGHSYAPLDEALSRVVVDLSGRPGLIYDVTYTRARVGDFLGRHEFIVTQRPVDGLVENFHVRQQCEQAGLIREIVRQRIEVASEGSDAGGQGLALGVGQGESGDRNTSWRRRILGQRQRSNGEGNGEQDDGAH